MDISNEQWQLLEPFFELKKPGSRGRPPREPREVLPEFYGYYEQEHSGNIYQIIIHLIKLVTGGFKNGLMMD